MLLFFLVSAIVIRDNPLLEEIVFGNGTPSSRFVPPIMVRGNRKLSAESIANLNRIKSGVHSKRTAIQAFGECTAPKPLTSLDDLVGCESVFGDIVLRGNTLLPPNKPLKPFNLTGCVLVKNSKVENIDFLRNMKAHIIPPWVCKNEKVCMGGTVTPDYISSTIAGYQCAVIKDNVIIENWKDNTTALQHLKSIRKMIGILHVLNNPDLVKLDFLANLQEIDAGTKEKRAAVHISNNSALRELQLVSLRSVKSNASKTIVVENNPLLRADVNT
ncbi:unnamed protein product [Angiostrongylus costaricensis]|uniref:Recep_L_domain domain-containing protein n=1 Tax=Angiostrongylus costaricensis TaxID=334426 RepID=A0A158PIB9_ANGCS|nr:unnamed protein product [Angiostrongylus costaricensis]